MRGESSRSSSSSSQQKTKETHVAASKPPETVRGRAAAAAGVAAAAAAWPSDAVGLLATARAAGAARADGDLERVDEPPVLGVAVAAVVAAA